MNKRICFLLNGLRIGGAEIQTIALANGFAQRGYEVTIVALDSRNEVIDRIDDRISLHVMNKRRYLDLSVLRRLCDLLRKNKTDILISVNSYATMYATLASMLGGRAKARFAVMHTTLFHDRSEKLKHLYYRPMINAAKGIVFVSSNQRDHWVANLGAKKDKAIVIHNGINLSHFQGANTEGLSVNDSIGEFCEGHVVLGICASFRPEKKHEDLIAAVHRLRQKGYPVRVLLIGDGNRRKEIEACIHEHGMWNDVHITGFVTDVRPFLKCLDIFVLTSVAVETLSIAALEAMAMKKPIVLSRIGGAAELVEEGVNGYLYPAGDVNALSSVLESMLERDLLIQMGEASLEKCRREFDAGVMLDRYEAYVTGGTKHLGP